MVVMNLSYQDILELATKYDEDHSWWTKEEKRIGDQIREDKEFGMDTLKEIVHWKFLTSPPYKEKTVNKYLKNHTDEEVRELTSWVLSLPTNEDNNKVTGLRKLLGIGISLASTILTFHNPQDYCVYDIHIMREVYGEEPKYMYTSNNHYLRLLEYLRLESKKLELPVRTIEKALFKKNVDGSRKR